MSELAEVLDQSVNLVGRELIVPPERAKGDALDLAGHPAVLDDVDILVGAVSVLAAAELDEQPPLQ